MFVCQSVQVRVCLSVNLSVCLSVHFYVDQPVSSPTGLSVCLPVYMSVYVFFLLYIFNMHIDLGIDHVYYIMYTYFEKDE